MNMGINRRLVFEPDTTQEQRMKVLKSYFDESDDKVNKAHRHPLFQEIKTILRLMEKDIFNDPNNAHLRREVRHE